jgi:hypothetical protein
MFSLAIHFYVVLHVSFWIRPYRQAGKISTFADCCETASCRLTCAGIFPYAFCFGRRRRDCCAIVILFWPAQSLECCTTSILSADAIPRMPRRFSYFGWHNYLDCRAASLILAGAIPLNAALLLFLLAGAIL